MESEIVIGLTTAENFHVYCVAQEMIWKYIIQVCKGLQHLHANNIIHRDIKPANIFVGDHDVIKVRTAPFISFLHLRNTLVNHHGV